ncbi:cell envelope integrity TolA C-terminal domain-containing protein [Enterobacter wuhouensis]|uniref:cell envelope integrity TolA C-terminal domain-containing protein n=1 Tax=Enterobacter wuhouensis TaxID=2529381 RepID=UPI002FCFF8E8
MKKHVFLLACVATLLAGCAPLQPSGCHKTTATGSCSSGRWDDRDEWGAQARGIRDAVNAQIADPQRWKGKQCRLHLAFAEDGTATEISTSSGNREYCEALKAAARKATFPPFTHPDVYRDFQRAGFDMRG